MTEYPQSNFHQINFILKQQDKKAEQKRLPSPSIQPKNAESVNAVRQPDAPDGNGQPNRLKSRGRKIAIGLIISLSAVMFGYGIKEITSVRIDKLVLIYSITMDKFIAQSILIGIMPIACIVGAIITRVLLRKFRRISGIYIFTIVNIGAIILVNITTFYTLLIGRFIEGICIGFYSAIAPIYLKQIAPKELRRMLGLFFSFGKIVGVLIVIFIEIIAVQVLNLDYAFRIILSPTAFFSVLQAVLIFFFGSDTPFELIERGQHDQAKKVIQNFYHPQHVEQVLEQYTQQYEASQADPTDNDDEKNKDKKKKRKAPKEKELQKTYKHGHDLSKSRLQDEEKKKQKKQMESFYESDFDVKKSDVQGENQSRQEINSLASIVTQQPRLTFQQKKNKAYILGVHMAAIRNFVGANAIITQGGIFISMTNPELGKWTDLIVNVVQFFAVVFGMVYVQTIMGKKPLFLISIPLLSVLNFALVIAMIYHEVTAMMMIMCLFMIVFGAGFINPIWAYPSQVIPAAQQLPANILHWISIAICMLVPPLVSSFMPGNTSFPVFIFFGIYSFIGFYHVRSTLRESDGLTYKQIIESFK